MPAKIDLSTAPYFDDFDIKKDYYKVLFTPGVAVQTRELNQLQSMLQNQIEKFGDNILKRGTTVEGCSISLLDKMSYVKIKDLNTEGSPVNINAITGLSIKNSSGLIGKISLVEDGLESSVPNLKTLYVNYTNSGSSGTENSFLADQNLTIFNDSNPLFKFKVVNGSSGFSNSDVIVVSPTLALQNSSGGKDIAIGGRPIQTNDIISTDKLSRVQIVSVDNTHIDSLIVRVKPLTEDLRTNDSSKWDVPENSLVEILEPNGTSMSSGNRVVETFGKGATGSLVTDSLGKILSINVLNGGSGYSYIPYVSVSSTTATPNDFNVLDILPQNFLYIISVASNQNNPIGYGYGVSIDEGVIYQKGYFVRVEKQIKVVEKYNNTNFNKLLGFVTEEEVVDSNVDLSLLDNALGEPNHTAPGANRLKLKPRLIVIDGLEAQQENDFYAIVKFSDGQPYIQNNKTQYNIVNDMIAQRTFEESGNYVVDSFSLITKDNANTSVSNTFSVHIDPGTAYINGYRVKTDTNFVISNEKGIDEVTRENISSTLYYGDYFRVTQLAGDFGYSTGEIVDLYDTPALFLNTVNPGVTDIAPVGNKIGTARVRSLILESGYSGTPDAVYKLFTFDRAFLPGKNASQIRSIHRSGESKAICDILLENNVSVVYEQSNSGLLFKIGEASKAVSNVSFYIKETNQYNMSSNGTLTIIPNDIITESLDEFFENTFGENEILVIPQENFQTAQNMTGTVVLTSGSPSLVGTSTTFLSELAIGDHIRISNNISHTYQIKNVANNTLATLTKNATGNLSSSTFRRFFPKSIPVSLSTPNTSRTARVLSNQLNINLGLPSGFTLANNSLQAVTPSLLVSFNVKKRFSSSVAKTPLRDRFVRIKVANNSAGTQGPFALGVSEVFRLKQVLKANGAVQTVTFSTNSNSIKAGGFISIPNHPFSNGDLVTYNTGSFNALSGLTNSASYVVSSANSSGMKIANSSGGVIEVVTDFQNANQTLFGSPIKFGPDTNQVEDVTNNFAIDNNQTAELINTSYLVRTGSSAISTNDVFLVKFDYFNENTNDGPKTVSSYTINDSLSLDNMTAGSISTYEIPEMYENLTDKYYDLRDYLDLRPVSQSTTIPDTDYSSAFINPIEPVNSAPALASFNASTQINSGTETITITSNPFVLGDVVKYFTGVGNTPVLSNNSLYYIKTVSGDNVTLSTYESGPNGPTVNLTAGTGTGHNLERSLLKFNSSKKFFPVPNSVCSFNVTSYLGRIDRVVIGSDSEFRIIKGTPGNMDLIPQAPSDGMTIDLIKIPPYPSVPQILSADRSKLLDTKIVNQKNFVRNIVYKVSTILDEKDKSVLQIKPYRMKDIAKLERRIDSLEYYATLSRIEGAANSRFIPSRINQNIDRFKYGIFVDSFSSYDMGDVNHPEYNATIVNDFLFSKTSEVNLQFVFDEESEGVINESTGGFENEQMTLISQLDSTIVVRENSTDNVTQPGSIDNSDITTITQVIESSYGQHRSAARGENEKTVWEDWNYTFSELPGQARFYINAREQRVQIEVYQGKTPDVQPINPVVTSLSWRQFDIIDTSFGGEAVGLDSIVRHDTPRFSSYPWVIHSFKLSWNHNPENGKYYLIRIFKGKHLTSGLFGNRKSPKGFYAFKLWYPIDKIATTTSPSSNNPLFNYSGVVSSIEPETFVLSQSVELGSINQFTNFTSGSYISDSQRFDISVSGLRPLTKHRFIFDGEDATSKCVQIRNMFSNFTDGLYTDINGQMSFSFFYDAGINAATTNFQQQNLLAASIAGRKSFTVENSDRTSSAAGMINMRYYSTNNGRSTNVPFNGGDELSDRNLSDLLINTEFNGNIFNERDLF